MLPTENTVVAHITVDKCNLSISPSQLSLNVPSLSTSSSYDFSGSCVAMAGSRHSDLCQTLLDDYSTPDGVTVTRDHQSPDNQTLIAFDQSSMSKSVENSLVSLHRDSESCSGAIMFYAKAKNGGSSGGSDVFGARPRSIFRSPNKSAGSRTMSHLEAFSRKVRSYSLQPTFLARFHKCREENGVNNDDKGSSGKCSRRPTFQLYPENNSEATVTMVSSIVAVCVNYKNK